MNKEILVLTGCGLDIRVDSGSLQIRDGFPHTGDIRETVIYRGLNTIEHIVILGQSGALTFEAIKWMIDQNIMVTFLDNDGSTITNLMPENHVYGQVKRRQATASEELNRRIASWLLAEKVQEQARTLNWLQTRLGKNDEWNRIRRNQIQQVIALAQENKNKFITCPTINDLMLTEAAVAIAYWRCFEDMPLVWHTQKKIPPNWNTIGNRSSPKTRSPQKAIDPFNACLNYLYTVLESRVRLYCMSNNVDPDLGVLHQDHGSRTSLIFDLMEPIRPKVDRLLFQWISNQVFSPKDFFETREGVCRVSQGIIGEIIPLIKTLDSSINNVIKLYARYFKDRAVIQKPGEFGKRENLNIPDTPDNSEEMRQVDLGTKVNKDDATISGSRGNRVCPECGLVFMPIRIDQNFCCPEHSRQNIRRQNRIRWNAEGKCQICGKPIPEGAKGVFKDKVKHCPDCAARMKRYYEEKKARTV
jgi:CRISPR-associated protein Cas1